jgi:hypothetical protein
VSLTSPRSLTQNAGSAAMKASMAIDAALRWIIDTLRGVPQAPCRVRDAGGKCCDVLVLLGTLVGSELVCFGAGCRRPLAAVL